MPINKSIFNLRFDANQAILPSAEELNSFLDSPKREGRMGTHREDLAGYSGLVAAAKEFAVSRQRGGALSDFNDKLYYGILAHSGMVTPELCSAVAEFKYYLHALSTIDLKKPVAFIKAAEEEISRLKPGKKDEAARIARLQAMVDERRKDLEEQKKRWPALRAEMAAVAGHIRKNLEAIQKRCEASIVMLVDLQVGKKAESRLIEDIKTHFKDQIRDYLQHGPVTREYVESMKETVAHLSKLISVQLLEDIYAMTGLLETLHDHARAFITRLDPLIKQGGRPSAIIDEDKELFVKLERELVSLLSDLKMQSKPARDILKDAEHEKILLEKRRDMLDSLFDLLKH